MSKAFLQDNLLINKCIWWFYVLQSTVLLGEVSLRFQEITMLIDDSRLVWILIFYYYHLTHYFNSFPQTPDENQELARRLTAYIVTACEQLFRHYLRKSESMSIFHWLHKWILTYNNVLYKYVICFVYLDTVIHVFFIFYFYIDYIYTLFVCLSPEQTRHLYRSCKSRSAQDTARIRREQTVQ